MRTTHVFVGAIILAAALFMVYSLTSGFAVGSGLKVCPESCFLYSGSGGPAGKIEVNCLVGEKNVGKELPICAGIESYNGLRERICSCVPESPK